MEDQYKKMEEAVEVDDKTQEIVNKYKEKYLGPESPYHKANWISLATFGWLNPMFEQEYHYQLREIDTGESCTSRIKNTWKKRFPRGTQPPGNKTSAIGLLMVVLRTYPWYFVLYATLSTLFSIADFLNAKILNLALKELEHMTPDLSFFQRLLSAGKLVFALMMSDLLLTVLKVQNNYILKLLTERIRHGINGLIFDKVMRKSVQRDTTFTLGEITNLTQVDTSKISNMGTTMNRFIIAPMEIIIGVVWLYSLVGLALLPGLVVILLSIFGNVYISSLYKRYRTRFLSAKDARGKLITEVFTNIRFIKMTGLENYFLEKIHLVKEEELLWIKRQLMRAVFSITMNNAAPLLFSATVFGTYTYLYGIMDIPTIFTVMQVYNIFKRNFQGIPWMLVWIMDMTVSGQRLSFFLLSEEIDDSYIQKIPATEHNNGFAIEIKNGNFYWTDEDLKRLYQEEKDRIAEKGKKKKDKKKDKKEKKKAKKRALISEQGSSIIRSRPSVLSLKSLRSDLSEGGETSNSKRDSDQFKSAFDDSYQFEHFRKATEGTLTASLLTGGHDEIENLYRGINLNLSDINIKIPKGQCVALIGKVGCGKSSLLSCLSGELYYKIGSQIKICGKTSYVSQTAWITSKTIRENILFGLPYEKQRYEDSIKYACMEDDLKILDKGDLTQLGDKGINLSGGQKIRLSIARAMYSNRDIFLFDDPISALDIHVGKYVMQEGIIGYLKGKTRIVATHAIGYLKFFDYIYVLDEGHIIEHGTYEEIVETQVYQEIQESIKKEEEEKKKKEEEEGANKKQTATLQFDDPEPAKQIDNQEGENKDGTDQKEASLLSLEREKLKKEQTSAKVTDQSMVSVTKDLDDPKQKKLIEDIIMAEDRAKGAMSWSVVWKWLGLSGGTPRYTFLCLIQIIWCFTNAGIPWFLQWFSTNYSGLNLSGNREIQIFLSLYLSINLMQVVCDFLRAWNIFMGNVELSREVNFLMSFRLMHASISKYFDRVPLGRILNRFIKDIQTVDMMLAWSTSFLVWSAFRSLTTFFVTALSSNVSTFVFIGFYVWVSYKVQRYYMNLLREMVRLRSISSSPIIQIFKESLDGVSTLRSFEQYPSFFRSYLDAINIYQQNNIGQVASRCWFKFRVSMLSLLVVIPCITIALFSNKSVGIFALMLNYLLQLTPAINDLLDTVSNHENRLISLERCCYFMNVVPEVGYKGLELLEKALRRGKDIKLNTNRLAWPTQGHLQIKNLSVRYRKNLPYVLKKLNLDIKPGTKVGIVGRTGAGKTTLISSIYRTFDEFKGRILIDGKEIRDVDLKILRYTMTIIPQDPYLFADSVRNNIDPMNQFKDPQIEQILQEVGLWNKFGNSNGLDFKIEKGGGNLSQGEKQLLCLARALLFNNKLVLMDEATSNIDTQTEAKIQELIKDRFSKSTILMIAHRLNTILHCDKVLVLDQGEILEYDDLKNLKGNEKSHFGRMLMKSDEIAASLQ